MSPAGLAGARAFGVPFVVWAHAKELLAWQSVLRRCLPAAAAVLVISEYTRTLVAALGVRPERTVLIPYAPDCGIADATTISLGANKNTHRPTILTVARMDELYKGHDVMLRALPLIAARIPDVQWIVVGDGPLRSYYEKLARMYGVDRLVYFKGAVSRNERDHWLAACDVFVMVSRDRRIDGGGEGFGISFLEANAFGKPVVAGRAGGSVDAVVDGITGRLVEPEDPIEVAEVVSLLLLSPELAHQLGESGRVRIQSDLSWARTAAVIEDVLLDVARKD